MDNNPDYSDSNILPHTSSLENRPLTFSERHPHQAEGSVLSHAKVPGKPNPIL